MATKRPSCFARHLQCSHRLKGGTPHARATCVQRLRILDICANHDTDMTAPCSGGRREWSAHKKTAAPMTTLKTQPFSCSTINTTCSMQSKAKLQYLALVRTPRLPCCFHHVRAAFTLSVLCCAQLAIARNSLKRVHVRRPVARPGYKGHDGVAEAGRQVGGRGGDARSGRSHCVCGGPRAAVACRRAVRASACGLTSEPCRRCRLHAFV